MLFPDCTAESSFSNCKKDSQFDFFGLLRSTWCGSVGLVQIGVTNCAKMVCVIEMMAALTFGYQGLLNETNFVFVYKMIFASADPVKAQKHNPKT